MGIPAGGRELPGRGHAPGAHADASLGLAHRRRATRLPGLRAPSPERDQEPEPVLPAAEEPVSFEKHIKPLFRRRDRQSMSFAFDLWSHDDVSQHAAAILDRLAAGTMPCDGAWPAEKTAVFRRWVDAGTPA